MTDDQHQQLAGANFQPTSKARTTTGPIVLVM